METKYAKDAIHVCRLMFGQAVLELLADRQPVTHCALKEKIKVMLPDGRPELVYQTAMELLDHSVH